MADEAEKTPAVEQEDDQRVPYERFQKVNVQAREAKAKADEFEKELADLRAQLEERQTAGLPELEQERKARERAEKRAQEAEERAEQTQRAVERERKRTLITQAAQRENFHDPQDAVLRLDLDDLDEADISAAVKRTAKDNKHLVRQEDKAPKVGQVVRDGRPADPKDQRRPVDPLREADLAFAEGAAHELGRRLERQWQSVTTGDE